MIRGFLAAYGLRLALLALLAALAIAGWQQTQVWRLEARISQANEKLLRQAQDIRERDKLISDQNTAVQAWRGAAEIQARQIAAAQTKAAQQQRDSTSRVVRVMQQPVPSDCPAAVRWAAQEGITLAKAWETGQ